METNIPIYRAKKKDSNEYTEGFLYQDIVSYVSSDGVKSDEYNKALDEESWFLMDNMGRNEMIDITTLAIHFPDMVDSNENKIFASLQEDGKGGDICQTIDYLNGTLNGVATYDNFSFRIHRIGKAMGISFTSKDIKIIGIKE